MLMAIAITSCQTASLNSHNPKTGSHLKVTIHGDQLSAEEINLLVDGMFSIENKDLPTKEVRKRTEEWAKKNIDKKVYLNISRTVKTPHGKIFSESYSPIPIIRIILIIIGGILIFLEISGVTEIIAGILSIIRGYW